MQAIHMEQLKGIWILASQSMAQGPKSLLVFSLALEDIAQWPSRTCCSLSLCFLLSGFILGAAIVQTAQLKAVPVCLPQFYPESEIKVFIRLCFPEGLRPRLYPCYFLILEAFIGLGEGPPGLYCCLHVAVFSPCLCPQFLLGVCLCLWFPLRMASASSETLVRSFSPVDKYIALMF